MSYAEACAQAATDQGLDPMIARLTAEGITHEVAQTGGMCMVIEIRLGEQDYPLLGVTLGDDMEDSNRWLVIRYDDVDDCEGSVLGDEVPIDVAVTVIRSALDGNTIITPSAVATKADDLGYAWAVECEGEGCTHRILSPKKSERPLTPFDAAAYDQGRYIGETETIVNTAPGARRCATCGPVNNT